MRVDVLTLFPEMFSSINESILLRAQKDGKLEINIHNIRDHSTDAHCKCDDAPFGGGSGMVMTAQPICDAISSIITPEAKVLCMSPRGRVFSQSVAEELSQLSHIIVICGHYEGIDQRVIALNNAEEISIGDYVLTGGELPAMVVIDSVCRLVDGVISSGSLDDESFNNNLLEYDQYTRPAEYCGIKVPDVLLSGNHAEINKFRQKNALEYTKKNRPDLLKK